MYVLIESITHLRTLAYAGKDVFIVAYSVTDYASFWSVFDRWVPELRARTPLDQQHIPIILAAFKADLCADVDDYQPTPQTIAARDALARGEPRQWRYPYHDDEKSKEKKPTSDDPPSSSSTAPAPDGATRRRRRVYGPPDGSGHMWPPALHARGPVTYDEGLAMAHLVGAAGFVEVSALTQRGLRQLFDMSIRVGLQHRQSMTGSTRRPVKKCAVQ